MNRADTPDVVQAVFVYLLSRVDTVTHMTPSLATTAVKHVAIREASSARARYTRSLDHAGLLLMERLMERQRRGVKLHEAVRLPEPVA